MNFDFFFFEVIDLEVSFEYLSFIYIFIFYIFMVEILKMNIINLNRWISNYREKWRGKNGYKYMKRRLINVIYIMLKYRVN